jgi:superfamily II DNA or RNA helicase
MLRPSQARCAAFINAGEDGLIFADVATGKTAIGLTAMVDTPALRWLVMAPEKVARRRWPEEFPKWEHTARLDLQHAGGSPSKRLDVVGGSAQVVTLGYDCLQWFLMLADDPFAQFRFDAVFFDEIDKLKDATSKRFKLLARSRGELLRPLKKRVGATGTPTPTHLLNCWAEAYLIDLGATFGSSYDKFRRKYFYPTDYKQYDWAPLPGTEEHIYNALAGMVERIDRSDCKDEMPTVVDDIDHPRVIELPARLMKQYRTLERKLALQIDGTPHEVMADNRASLSSMLQQFTSGFLYDADNIYPLHHAKYDDLAELVSELQGAQLMVLYHFIEQADQLQRRYPNSRRLGGGVSAAEADETMDLWNAGKLEMLVLHKDSAGHGLDLQLSQARHIYFLQRPWSAGAIEQIAGRLARPGGADNVFLHTPVVHGTIDDDVLAVNRHRDGELRRFREAFKTRMATL